MPAVSYYQVKIATMKSKKCIECGHEVSVLDIFSQGECLDCHEKAFRFDGSAPDFIGTLNV